MKNLPGFTAAAVFRTAAAPTSSQPLQPASDGDVVPAMRCCETCDWVCEQYGADSRQCSACFGNCIMCSENRGGPHPEEEPPRQQICKTDKWGTHCWWFP